MLSKTYNRREIETRVKNSFSKTIKMFQTQNQPNVDPPKREGGRCNKKIKLQMELKIVRKWNKFGPNVCLEESNQSLNDYRSLQSELLFVLHDLNKRGF